MGPDPGFSHSHARASASNLLDLKKKERKERKRGKKDHGRLICATFHAVNGERDGIKMFTEKSAPLKHSFHPGKQREARQKAEGFI